MDKQIEEIAEVVEKTFEVAKRIGAVCPSPRMIATDLNDAGYRKQSKGEWEEYQIPNIICCSKCDWGTGVENKHQFKFCPNCGADMRGNK